MRGLKIQRFFQKYKLHKEKRRFDLLLEVGAQYRTLQWLLWIWASENNLSFWASERCIIGYCRREGLYEKRRIAKAAKSRREWDFKPKNKGWTVQEYQVLIESRRR